MNYARTIITACVTFLFLYLPSSATSQTVANTRYYFISDDKIIIYYDLPEPGTWNISVEASLDGGKSFTLKPQALSGDVGDGIVSGEFKRIEWNISADGLKSSKDIVVRVVTVDYTGSVLSSRESPDNTIFAVPIKSPVKLDGLLTEPFWKSAAPASGFIQKEQVEGAPATEKTEVRIVYDRDNIYIGVMCFDREPGAIIHNELQRDVDLDSDDNFTVVLDTSNSKRNGYFFEINPNGARYDGFFYGTELLNTNWDGVWDARARITDRGWSAEIMIPFKTLRFPNTVIQEWGINFKRIIRRKSEEVLWRSWRRDDGLFQLIKSGRLLGLENIKKGRKVELIPYILGGMESDESEEGSEFNYGLDVKYPVTSDITLNVTTHTDFAQVETDRERINLTRFSLFYPEKREFFLEGQEIYDFDSGYFQKVYHSRRIGISPEREQIPILGGLNLAGKAGPYSLGILNIQTDKKGTNPGTNYTVVRIKRDVLERSRIGFIATNLDDENDHTNRTLGADFFYQTNRLMGNKNFGIRGDLTGSFTDGRHNDNLFGRLFIDYPNDFIDSFFEFYHVGEQFNPEMGFITRTGIRRANGKIRFFPRPRIPGVNKLIFMPLGLNYTADIDGKVLERCVSFWPFGILTTSNDMLMFTIEDNYDLVERDFTLFGGRIIPADSYNWMTYGVQFQSNSSRPLSFDLYADRGDYYYGERDTISPGCTVKLNKYISASTDLLYNDITLGDDHIITREYSGRLHLNISTKLTTSTFIQYNNETSEVNMNFRLHYLPNIGSDLYFVYNHLWDESRDYTTKYRTGIIKLDYLIRL